MANAGQPQEPRGDQTSSCRSARARRCCCAATSTTRWSSDIPQAGRRGVRAHAGAAGDGIEQEARAAEIRRAADREVQDRPEAHRHRRPRLGRTGRRPIRRRIAASKCSGSRLSERSRPVADVLKIFTQPVHRVRIAPKTDGITRRDMMQRSLLAAAGRAAQRALRPRRPGPRGPRRRHRRRLQRPGGGLRAVAGRATTSPSSRRATASAAASSASPTSCRARTSRAAAS